MSQISTLTDTQITNDANLIVNLATHHHTMTKRIIIGSFLGLAWGASLRAWMVVLALEGGERSHFTWSGTFGGILLPAALMGVILGGATHTAETSGKTRWRWAILSPLLLIAGPVIFTKDFIPTLLTTGLGGGAVGVALIGLLGGYALSPFGVRWTRWLSGLFVFLLLTAALGYGVYSAIVMANTSRAFAVLLFVLLMVLLVAGVSVPSRCWLKRNIS
jgi:hypothetical protein